MKEILPGVFHWSTYHPGIGATVHSYLIAVSHPPVVLDPRVPSEGLGIIKCIVRPRHIFLTNRLHYRHSGRFARAFQAKIWAHRAGKKAFRLKRHRVHLFEHGDWLPGKIQPLKIGSLCPEETAFLIPLHGGILSIGDAVIREGNHLSFVPDFLMGDNPEAVKQGMIHSLRRILRYNFDHLLLAHGEPWIRGGKKALRDFVKKH